jgi:hypothetical protein
MELNVKFTFDENTYRHYMNGFLTVLHCHHYLCLTTRMAEDFMDLGGIKILREAAEDSIRPMLDDYFFKNGVSSIEDKFNVGTQYYAVMGMGKMKIKANQHGGTVMLPRSHLDQGWLKRWGKSDQPVNHFTCGFIGAIFAAAFGKAPHSYEVTEIDSIVQGSAASQFTVKLAQGGMEP